MPPLASPNPQHVSTRVDMSPFGYPIILWRLFVPNLVEYKDDLTPPLLTIQFYIRTLKRQFTIWYSRRAAILCWASGGIILQRGIANSFPVATVRYITVQPACCLLMNPQGVELADSRWVYIIKTLLDSSIRAHSVDRPAEGGTTQLINYTVRNWRIRLQS